MKRLLSLDNYLQQLGGWYIIVIIAIAQLPTIIVTLLSGISIRHNAGFDPEISAKISLFISLWSLVGILILLVVAWYLTPNARQRLTDWIRNQLKANPKEELAAWQEITVLIVRYGAAAVFVSYVVSILPAAVYYYRANAITFDQFMYTLLGGLVSVLATTIIAVLIIDRLSIPARLAL